MSGTQGNDNTIGVYLKEREQNTPDTDSIQIDLSPQTINVTPDVRYRHARMYYKWTIDIAQASAVNVTFNTVVNWSDDSLYTLLIDNSNTSKILQFNFSLDYKFLDDNPSSSRSIIIDPGKRIQLYMSLISGKLYVKKSINSDPLIYG